jgi:hypothetical protein
MVRIALPCSLAILDKLVVDVMPVMLGQYCTGSDSGSGNSVKSAL